MRGRVAFRIIEGIIIGLFNIQNEGFRSAKESLEETERAIEKDWKNIWKNGLEEINLEFFELTMEIVNRQLLKYEEEVKWVLKTNLFSFVINHVVEGRANILLQKLKEEEDDTARTT